MPAAWLRSFCAQSVQPDISLRVLAKLFPDRHCRKVHTSEISRSRPKWCSVKTCVLCRRMPNWQKQTCFCYLTFLFFFSKRSDTRTQTMAGRRWSVALCTVDFVSLDISPFLTLISGCQRFGKVGSFWCYSPWIEVHTECSWVALSSHRFHKSFGPGCSKKGLSEPSKKVNTMILLALV